MKNYNVKINKKSVKVQSCRVSAIPFNQMWPGYQRPLEQTEVAFFVNYCGELPVNIEVDVSLNTQWFDVEEMPFRITPQSKNIEIMVSGDKIIFEIDSYGQYVLDKDGHSPLCLFISSSCVQQAATYCYTKGVYNVGQLNLKSNESVYIAEDAVVRGSITAYGATNIKIFGRGILDGGYEERKSFHCYEDYTLGTIKLYECENVEIEGIILRDSAIWVINLFGCKNINIDGVKIIGHYKYNTDGMDIVNCSDVAVKNSFVWVFDDGITLKAIDKYNYISVKNIFVDNCVLWCGWGRTLEIGLETACQKFSNIVFKNCDLIHNSAVAIDIQNGDYALVENILFENIRVEFQSNTLPEVLQLGVSDFYENNGQFATPYLIGINNPKYNFEDCEVMNRRVENFARIENVVFRNIQAVGSGAVPEVYIDNCALEQDKDSTCAEIKDITFDNISFNGQTLPIDKYKVNIDKKLFKIIT